MTEPTVVLNLRTITTEMRRDGQTIVLVVSDGDHTVEFSTCGGGPDAAEGANNLADAAGLVWEEQSCALKSDLYWPRRAGEQG